MDASTSSNKYYLGLMMKNLNDSNLLNYGLMRFENYAESLPIVKVAG